MKFICKIGKNFKKVSETYHLKFTINLIKIIDLLQILHVIFTNYITRSEIFAKKTKPRPKKNGLSYHFLTITLKPCHSLSYYIMKPIPYLHTCQWSRKSFPYLKTWDTTGTPPFLLTLLLLTIIARFSST